jgi:hypothetical protein
MLAHAVTTAAALLNSPTRAPSRTNPGETKATRHDRRVAFVDAYRPYTEMQLLPMSGESGSRFHPPHRSFN